ncbi:MAG: rhomboid family intramembrane serine protease, partial [Candidatus Hydrogenedentales bacterium]|jgi:membrane associated rhomboid family serine protease
MGAFMALHSGAHIRMFIINTIVPIPALVYLGLWFGMQLLFTVLTSSGSVAGRVAYAAHAGGFLAGLGIALLYKAVKKRQLTAS